MNKILIYTIQPEHIVNILNGKKTIEIRKRDLPQWAKDKIDRGEVVEGYGYCTKGGLFLIYQNDTYIEGYALTDTLDRIRMSHKNDTLNGLVVVKFQVSGSDKIYDYHIVDGTVRVSSVYETDNLLQDELLDKACLTLNQISNYVGMNDSYAHHFTNITPIEPMELSNFYSFGSQDHHDFITTSTMIQEDERKYYIESYKLRKAPQSFMTAWVKGE